MFSENIFQIEFDLSTSFFCFYPQYFIVRNAVIQLPMAFFNGIHYVHANWSKIFIRVINTIFYISVLIRILRALFSLLDRFCISRVFFKKDINCIPKVPPKIIYFHVLSRRYKFIFKTKTFVFSQKRLVLILKKILLSSFGL